MKTVIEMAREAGFMLRAESVEGQDDWWECFDSEIEALVALVRADEVKRADALAATITALRDIVTSEAESKADFIVRVRNVLGACPDQRVLHAVEAEREACAKVCDEYDGSWYVHRIGAQECAAAIRARGNT